jgi:hypothetical protein
VRSRHSPRGTLYRTVGPPIDMSPWDPARVTPIAVGSVSLTFTEANSGTLAYTVDGISGSKPITRQAFATPHGLPLAPAEWTGGDVLPHPAQAGGRAF